MPLLNKKPIGPVAAIPANLVYSNPDAEVFFIEFTGEIFLSYDEFIARYTLYKKRVWTCEVTGKSGLTFKEAMECEQAARRKYDSKFPEVWRKTALEKLHWNTNTLLFLHDYLHEYFKERIFLGELVGVELGPDEYNAVVVEILTNPNTPEQVSYNMKTCPAEPPEAKSCEFVVHLSTGDGQLLDDTDPKCPVRYQFSAAKIKRNRKAMSKQNFKAFIKDSAIKENWNGAPWIVKSDLVRRYNLPVQPPDSVTASTDDKKKKVLFVITLLLIQSSFLNPKRKQLKSRTRKQKVLFGFRKEILTCEVQFPIEDLELPMRAPRPLVDESGVPFPERPPPITTFYNIPSDMLSLLIQSWYFLSVFGYWTDGLDTLATQSLYPTLHDGEVKDEYLQKFLSRVESMSDDERVSIDQWYKWFPGRWSTEVDGGKGGRGPKAIQDHTKRLKAWEVALIGFLKDAVPEHKLPNKWKIMYLLTGAETDDTFILEAEEKKDAEMKEAELNGDSMDATSPPSIENESDPEVGGTRRSLRKRKRVIAYSSDEEEEDVIAAAKGVRSSSRLKAAAVQPTPAPPPPQEEVTENVQETYQPKPRGRPAKPRAAVDIDNLINLASKRFALLEVADKVSILNALIQHGALHSEIIRDYLEDAVDKAHELRKERREMGRDQKAVEQARAELEQKERIKNDEEETNGFHLEGKENGDSEIAEAVQTYDIDTVMKLKAEQARREEEEKRRREEAEKARKEHKEKQKELRKAQEKKERKKVDDSERALLKRQLSIEVELGMMTGVSRMSPLGCDRYFNRYWWFDGALGSLTPESEALDRMLKKSGVKVGGPLDWASGAIFVEDVGFKNEDRMKFFENNGSPTGGQWGYLSDASQFENLMKWLDPRGIREMGLLSALSHISEAAILGMRKRTEDLEKGLETTAVRRSSRGRHDGADEASYMRYLNIWSSHQLYKKGGLLQ
ncbi:hypothetical protein HDU67_010125 [Dinochytrium kinnereticum]|nr:hypothetical protein HDU67_010125 [Dinochytrium kinnereticum]